MKRTKKEKSKNIIEIDFNLSRTVITTIFSYDENVKSSNNKGFLLQTI